MLKLIPGLSCHNSHVTYDMIIPLDGLPNINPVIFPYLQISIWAIFSNYKFWFVSIFFPVSSILCQFSWNARHVMPMLWECVIYLIFVKDSNIVIFGNFYFCKFCCSTIVTVVERGIIRLRFSQIFLIALLSIWCIMSFCFSKMLYITYAYSLSSMHAQCKFYLQKRPSITFVQPNVGPNIYICICICLHHISSHRIASLHCAM